MAERLARERQNSRDPTTWGVDSNIVDLPTSRETVEVFEDPSRRGRIIHAKRSDVFSLVSLTLNQQVAAARYWRDWCHRAGIRTEDEAADRDIGKIDHSPGLAPGQYLNQRMIDAGRRLDEAHKEIGRGAAQLLRELVEPLVMLGQVRVWRVVVERQTGETERHAQAARVRAAVEDLALAYEEIDRREAERRKRQSAAAGDRLEA